MTARTRTDLKTSFETGDQPLGQDFVDLIDSCVNLQDTDSQFFVSDIQTPGVTVSTVSAQNLFTTNLFVAGSASGPEFAPSVISAQSVIASAIEATTMITSHTVSAQVVRASAVHYRNPHAHIYAPADQNTVLTGLNQYDTIVATISAAPNGFVGFTQNGTGSVTYTGSTTAAMHIGYSVGLCYFTAAAVVATCLFKNGLQAPESRCTNTMGESPISTVFAGSAILRMGTGDTVNVRLKTSAATTYTISVRSFDINIVPVSWEF